MKTAMFAFCALLSSQLFGSKLKIRVDDIIDGGFYEPVQTLEIEIQDEVTAIHKAIYEWGQISLPSGYHIEYQGYAKKIIVDDDETYFVHLEKYIYFEDECVGHLLGERHQDHVLTSFQEVIPFEYAYVAQGIHLVAKQRTVLSIIP